MKEILDGLSREIKKMPWIPLGKKEAGPGDQKLYIEALENDIDGIFCLVRSKKPCITTCMPRGDEKCRCEPVRQTLIDEINRVGIDMEVGVVKVGCAGECKIGPFIGFPQRGYFYLGMKVEQIPTIVTETIMRGKLLAEFLSVNPDRSYRQDILYDKKTGLMAAIDDHVCMVEVAKYFLDFEEGLSCGKCAPCRIGMKRMQEGLERIIGGQGSEEDLVMIRDLCQTMLEVPHCDFASVKSRPILSALTHFEDEFRAHIERQECPAGVCKDLVELQRKRAVRQRKKR